MKTKMRSKPKDNPESAILDTLERGELKRIKGASREMQAAKEAAENYLKKDARINIQLSGPDLKLLKRKAAAP